MTSRTNLIKIDTISARILRIRGERVIIDADLAEFYGVTTKALNQQVKRNRDRFPAGFVFQLNSEEKDEVVTNCDHLDRLRFASSPSFAFTEHGAIMAAGILNSPRAIEVSVFIVRAFVQMRRILTDRRELAIQLAELERRLSEHDDQLVEIVRVIRSILGEGPQPPRRRIGFQVETTPVSTTRDLAPAPGPSPPAPGLTSPVTPSF